MTASSRSDAHDSTSGLLRPTNVVFDFGKVIFDWEPAALVARLLPEQACDAASADDWVDRFFQDFQGDWGEFDRGRIEPAALAVRIAARTGLQVDTARRVIDAVPGELRPAPGMLALLDRLETAGRKRYFLSNMPIAYAARLEAEHAFLRRFDDGIFSGRVDLIKPDPAIFALAARRFGIEPAESLFIDDVQRNVDAALAGGWQALRFIDPAQCARELQGIGLLGG